MADPRVSQFITETMLGPDPIAVRLSQVVVEYQYPIVVAARTSQFLVEVAHNTPALIRVSQFIVEILRGIPNLCPPDIPPGPAAPEGCVPVWPTQV